MDFKTYDVVTTNQIPSDQFGVIEVAVNQALSFTANAATFAQYDWDFGDGTTHGTGVTTTHTYLSGGSPTVKLTVPANGTCAATVSHDLQVAGPVGPTGAFVARYSDNSLFRATQVASGKPMTFLATDTANTYTWDFGDGTPAAAGQTVSHTYITPGSTSVTYVARLAVVSATGQNASTTQSFTIIPPPAPPTWFVAGMAYLNGSVAGTLWQSDVTLFNPDPTRPATYSLAFLDGRNPVDPANLTWKQINLAAQQSISSANILGFFGQPLGSFGALLVRGDSAPTPPVITARTFNSGDSTKGTFGLSVPSTQPSSGLTPQAADAQQLLVGLRDDASAYTNVGLLNLTTDWSHAQLTFLDESGATTLGHVNVDVPPYGVAQLSRPLFQDPPNGVGFKDPLTAYSVKVTVSPGSGAVFPYATVIDLQSTDSIVVTASALPSPTYRMPGIIHLQGANNTQWRSRFYVTNPSTSSRKVTISYSYIPCDGTGCKNRVTIQGDVQMGAGETALGRRLRRRVAPAKRRDPGVPHDGLPGLVRRRLPGGRRPEPGAAARPRRDLQRPADRSRGPSGAGLHRHGRRLEHGREQAPPARRPRLERLVPDERRAFPRERYLGPVPGARPVGAPASSWRTRTSGSAARPRSSSSTTPGSSGRSPATRTGSRS